MMNNLNKSWKRGFEWAKLAMIHSDSPLLSKKMGAAIVQNGKLVAIGFNQYSKTHPNSREHSFDRNIHAEQAALIKRQHYDNTGGVLYVYRESAKGQPAHSEPCRICKNLIRLSGIRKVRYINQHGECEEIRL